MWAPDSVLIIWRRVKLIALAGTVQPRSDNRCLIHTEPVPK